MADERFTGHDGRECGEHRTTGQRAWCLNDSEWCTPHAPCRGCELPALRQRAEQDGATVERLHAFAESLQEPGAPLFWPVMGRRIQLELGDHGAGTGRCSSCLHPVTLHQPDGCWHAVTTGTPGRDSVCPCSVPRATLDQPKEALP